MFARGGINLITHADTLLAPRDAVEERGGKMLVFTVQEGKARSHEVRFGLGNGEIVEIMNPTSLKPGERVVVSGHEQLRDGTKVYVAD